MRRRRTSTKYSKPFASAPRYKLGIPDMGLPGQIDEDWLREEIYQLSAQVVEEISEVIGIPLDAAKVASLLVESKGVSALPTLAFGHMCWTGMSESARIKLFGNAGLSKSGLDVNGQSYNDYAHFGGEFWTKYVLSKSQAEESNEATVRGKRDITGYALIGYKAVLAGEQLTVVPPTSKTSIDPSSEGEVK